VFGPTPLLRFCKTCEVECLDPIPTEEELAAYYSGYLTTQADISALRELITWAKLGIERSFDRLGDKAPSLRGARWLEVGFGGGASLFAAAQSGARACGLDIDASAVERARQYARELGVEVEVLQGSIDELVAQGRRFDVVKASHVIEHTRDPRTFLRGLHAALAPGGVLILECPNNRAFLWLLKNATRSFMGRSMFYNGLKKTEHIWGFTYGRLCRLLSEEGFSVMDCEDYSVADPEYQPDVALWCPKWPLALRRFAQTRRRTPLVYATARSVDQASSRVFGAGSSLAVVAVRG
jgi:2-polyprenyl-3-methyl-5-hydroxy-6-metoxy-1,4-benzoquinol methylase